MAAAFPPAKGVTLAACCVPWLMYGKSDSLLGAYVAESYARLLRGDIKRD